MMKLKHGKSHSSILTSMVKWYLSEDYDMNGWVELIELFKESTKLMERFCEAASENDRRRCFEAIVKMASLEGQKL